MVKQAQIVTKFGNHFQLAEFTKGHISAGSYGNTCRNRICTKLLTPGVVEL